LVPKRVRKNRENGEMPATTKETQRRALTVERVAPALVVLAQGAYVREAAEPAGVSIATVLNWMDWAWKHRAEVDAYLQEQHPDLSQGQLAHLWKRIERRRVKRQRRRDFADWRSET
jgi:transposase